MMCLMDSIVQTGSIARGFENVDRLEACLFVSSVEIRPNFS